MRSVASNPLELELYVVVNHPGWYWEPKLGLLQEKYVLLSAEPMFQPPEKRSLFIFGGRE